MRRFLWCVACAISGLALAQEVAPIDAVLVKITNDAKSKLADVDVKYQRQIRPIEQQRATGIDQVERETLLRLDRAAKDAKELGSDVMGATINGERDRIRKLFQDARANQVSPSAVCRVAFQEHKYLAVLAPVSWAEARKMCEEMGGHLAYAETREELEFLAKLSRAHLHRRGLWLGAEDRRPDGWSWLNGQPVNPRLRMAQRSFAGETVGILELEANKPVVGDTSPTDGQMIGFICEWD